MELAAQIAHYEQAIATHPDDLPNYWHLGLARLLLGEADEANAVWLSAFAQVEPDALETAAAELLSILEQEATSQFRAGCFGQTVAIAQAMLELAPEQGATYVLLGDALGQQGNFDDALTCWQTAAELQPDLAETYLKQAAVYQKLEQYEAAIACYRAALEIQPNHPEAHSSLGLCLAEQGDWEQALPHFQQASNLGDWGCALLQKGELEQAVEVLHQLMRSRPDAVDAYQQLVQLRERLGRVDATLHANAILLEALQAEPQAANSYRLLGQLLAKTGDFARALAIFQLALMQAEGLESNEIQASLYLNLGNALAALKQFDRAIQSYQMAIQRCPNSAETYLELGKIFARMGHFAEAHSALQRALELRPDSVEAHLQQGNLYLAQQAWEAAIASYRPYLAIHPQATTVLCNLSIALAQVGDTRGAIAGFRKVMQINNNLSPAIWQIMTDLQQQGKFDAADPEFSNTLPTGLPTGFYATTQDWARDAAIAQGENSDDIYASNNPYYCPIYSAQIVHLRPPKTPTGEIHFSFRFNQEITLPASFVATIPEGRFWIDPDQSSTAILTQNNQLLTDLSPEFPALSPGHPDKYPGKHWLFIAEKLPPIERINGTVVVLAGLSTNVYFHWMFDILPKLELLRKSGLNLDSVDWFLAGDRFPFQQETLRQFNIPTHKVLTLEQHSHLQATQLIVPTPGDIAWMPPWVCDFLRRTFLPKETSPIQQSLLVPEWGAGVSPLPGGAAPTPPVHNQFVSTISTKTRLYISRSQTTNRRILNENQVVDFLEQYGFQTVALESLSVAEQASLFSQAEVIISPHGSGLTNLVFCAPETKVIEIFSPNFVYSCYWLISCLVELDYYYVLGELPWGFFLNKLLQSDPRTEDIFVNIDALKETLEFAKIL